MAEARLKPDLRDRLGEAENPHSHVARFGPDRPLKLDAGVELSPFQIAYQTYGTLNSARSNAVLICHALTGDQHVANVHPVTGKPGWWETHGRSRQADRHRSLLRDLSQRGWRLHGDDRTGFDQHQDRSSVRARLSRRHDPRHGPRAGHVARPSRNRQYCSRSPAARWAGCRCCNGRRAIRTAYSRHLPIACATRHSAQNIAFHEVGRQAVMADPEWRAGRYLAEGTNPRRGLAVARMAAHITYLSDAALHRKFGRRFQDRVNADLLVRRRLRGRELSATPRLVLRRAVRCQQLSLPDARDGLFRSRRRLRRGAGARRFAAPRRASA